MKRLRRKIADQVPNTIYHYTNGEGFEGIIKSREIWMTNALFVNDQTELRTALKDSTFRNVQFINSEFEVFKNEGAAIESRNIEDYYLASFSKLGKSLDQFRAYGSYCIGFDAKKLKKNTSLFRCVYKQKDIRDWLIRKDKLPEWQDECFNNEQGQSYKRAAFCNVEFARRTKLKNEHYSSEKEIRMLAVSNASWGWYSNSPEMFCNQRTIYFKNDPLFSCPVPYVKFFLPKKPKTRKELEKMVGRKSRIETKEIVRKIEEVQERDLLPIKKVIIGPMPHQEELVSATRVFLFENGYENEDVEIISSGIPFRG